MRIKRLIIVVLFTYVMWGLSGPVWAGQTIDIDIKIVLASHGPIFADPLLTAFIQKLQSIFRYSSYRLLRQHSMNLGIGKTGTVILHGDRVLKVTALEIIENRAELRLEIFKKRKLIFQTVFDLLNHSSIIVGGLKHKGGFLLFNIYSSF